MKLGVACLLVLGLANVRNVVCAGAELGLEGVSNSELKEIEKEIAKGNVPPNYQPSEKPKRGVTKLTSSDPPGFNHLPAAAPSKPLAANPSPLRYVYNPYNPYPYLPYIPQPHQASQIAAQYAFQPSGVPPHFLQTPNQIQYVSSPSIQQVPSAKYQSLTSKIPAPASPYVLTAPQAYLPQQYFTQTAAPSPATSPAAPGAAGTAQMSQMASQPFYYPQQPVVMLLVAPQPHPMSLLYNQHHQMAYLLGQHPLLNLYGGQRFGLPYQTQSNQLTYIVPMGHGAVAGMQVPQQATQAAASQAAADKSQQGQQEVAASSTFGLRTKS